MYIGYNILKEFLEVNLNYNLVYIWDANKKKPLQQRAICSILTEAETQYVSQTSKYRQ